MTNINPSLICHNMQVPELVLYSMLNTFVNILRVRVTDKNKFYNIKSVQDKVYVYALDRLKNTEKTLIAYDRKENIWFSGYKSAPELHRLMTRLRPLNEVELQQVTEQARYSVNIQEGLITALRGLRFIPINFYLQYRRQEEFIRLPRELPSVQKVTQGASVASVDRLLGDLLKSNRGLFLGHIYPEFNRYTKQFFQEQLPTLAAGNVKHIYEDMPVCNLHSAYENFNLNLEGSAEELANALQNIKAEYIPSRMEIYKAARERGIEIWPIDSYLNRDKLNERLKIASESMVRNLDYFSAKLKEGEKFVVLSGAAYYSVAEMASIPNLLIGSRPADKQEFLSKSQLVNPFDDVELLEFAVSRANIEDIDNIFFKKPDYFVQYGLSDVKIVKTDESVG